MYNFLRRLGIGASNSDPFSFGASNSDLFCWSYTDYLSEQINEEITSKWQKHQVSVYAIFYQDRRNSLNGHITIGLGGTTIKVVLHLNSLTFYKSTLFKTFWPPYISPLNKLLSALNYNQTKASSNFVHLTEKGQSELVAPWCCQMNKDFFLKGTEHGKYLQRGLSFESQSACESAFLNACAGFSLFRIRSQKERITFFYRSLDLEKHDSAHFSLNKAFALEKCDTLSKGKTTSKI